MLSHAEGISRFDNEGDGAEECFARTGVNSDH